MKLTPWGKAVDVRKDDTKSRLTARKLREAEYILVSRPDLQHTTDRSGRRFLMAVNRKLPAER